MFHSISCFKKIALLTLPFLLIGCGDDKIKEVIVEVEVPAPEPETMTLRYEVTVINLTNGQPISPPAVVLHDESDLWKVGSVASVPLERIAEEGSSTEFLALGYASSGGTDAILPGHKQTINVSINDITDAKLTIAAMLGNTNDGFTGINSWDLSQMEVGDRWSANGSAYDAGTERNTETVETVPGPAAGGEGFNPARDDTGYISFHPGVVSQDDGLGSSVLTGQEKFDNPVIRIHVTRIE